MVRNLHTIPQAIRVRKRIGIGGKIKLRPWGYESPFRQERKLLLFQKLQPPMIFEHFTFLPIADSP
jgi:hypothetical protein